jgi:serine/threonine protein phosphatase PrpC
MKNGRIVEMSTDHNPLLPSETLRILKAGSHISYDGRIDRNLNLSRTIGDFAHKKRPHLSREE